ncbi:MAG: class I tRNA ligase family protein [Patescibacteria group bacterium]
MYNSNEQEREILKYWDEHKCFEKSIENRSEKKPYHFFDGPPFATGLPHYGHIVASLMKDVVPRFWTMRGFRVERKWGWDCHGLPVENIIEKDLNLQSKKDIENFGIAKFNEACRSAVLRYADEWKKTIKRMGRWVDMDNDYKTMDLPYMESVWWVFKQLWDKNLIYKGHKAMHICPRCVTPLSNFEVTQNYKDIKDISVTAKFKVQSSKLKVDGDLYILAWTTTPWTLPGNVLLAINKSIKYQILSIEGEDGNYIVAKDRAEAVLKDKKYKIKKEVSGSGMIGLEYEPLFSYFKDTANCFRVVAADFVTTTDGTGVVHIAPAFGEDDYNVGKAEGVPLVQHVTMEGKFIPQVTDFAGMEVKPKDTPDFDDRSPQEGPVKADVEIIKWLAHNGKLFSKAKIEHSYPHCWRCDTPLLNYATSSWFIKVTELKKELLKNNEAINWVPEHIKEGRFGVWLEGAHDWAISRNRYWGTPLPVWENEDGEAICVGDVKELAELTGKKITKIIFTRHGESETNVKGVRTSALDGDNLTKKGEAEVVELAKKFDQKIDLIISSPIFRAKRTAEIINKKLKTELVFDPLLVEYSFGAWEGLTPDERHGQEDYKKYKKITSLEERFNFRLGSTGETRVEIVERIRKFVNQLLEKHKGKTILIVSHGGINAALCKVIQNISYEKYFQEENIDHNITKTYYADESGREFDLHKHFIDQLIIKKDGKEYKRIPEVLDCWFESGSMPYGQMHYPFENKKKFESGFPAEFIAEGQDQTRGWFYTLHVLATALTMGKKPSIPVKKSVAAFKNVIVNGIVLAEDGKKMSKRLKNYPEPEILLEKYGADAMRYYLATSPVMQAEALNFSETGVREMYNKVVNTVYNVLEFYLMYAGTGTGAVIPTSKEESLSGKKTDRDPSSAKASLGMTSKNILDKWILAKLQILIQDVTAGMEAYKLVDASRPIVDFVSELSQWYVRRSRDRFKGGDEKDKEQATVTLREVLLELSKVMAPFTPFIAEKIYLAVGGKMESVHLDNWPEVNKKLFNDDVLRDMILARKIVEMGLALRAEKGIKVRQPLSELLISEELGKDYLELIADELNVKKVKLEFKKMGDGIAVKEDGGLRVGLDATVTGELKKEGLAREIVRTINQIRKDNKLTIADRVAVKYGTDDQLLRSVFVEYAEEIKKSVLAERLESGDGGDEVEIGKGKVKIEVEKV